jgi:hypothetical protein
MADQDIITSAEALTKVGNLMQDAASAMETALSTWNHDRLAKPNGDDQFSHALNLVYTAEDNTSKTLNSTIDGLESMSLDFTNMATTYESAEAHNRL